MPDDSEKLASETPKFKIGESISYNLRIGSYSTGQVKGFLTERHPIDKDRDIVTVLVGNAVLIEQKRRLGLGPKFWEATHLSGEQRVLQRFTFPLGYATEKYNAASPQ